MTSRTAFVSCLVVISAAAVWAVLAQQHELTSLRAEQQLQTTTHPQPGESSVSPPADTANRPASNGGAPAELLRLRDDITKLTRQRDTLANVRAENERLRAQVAARGTNARSGAALPPGYIRASEARMAGYRTPQDTIQSFLWAVRKHDVTNLLEALIPVSAQQFLQTHGAANGEEFFKQAEALPGLRVVSQKTLDDGSIEMQLEVIPGVPMETIRFQQIDGEWKMSGLF
jgi:hypothetical protein